MPLRASLIQHKKDGDLRIPDINFFSMIKKKNRVNFIWSLLIRRKDLFIIYPFPREVKRGIRTKSSLCGEKQN